MRLLRLRLVRKKHTLLLRTYDENTHLRASALTLVDTIC